MHLMERIEAVQAATESDTPFRHATNMEDPLTSIGVLVSALCLISETMEEPFGLVVQELARNIGELVQKLDKEHSYFFDLHHPCPPLDHLFSPPVPTPAGFSLRGQQIVPLMQPGKSKVGGWNA